MVPRPFSYGGLFGGPNHGLGFRMPFVEPLYSKNQVNRAGDILTVSEDFFNPDWVWANDVLANWRGCHGYPINTFQSTLRQKLKTIDADAIVAQRLKRAPSIITKLQRFDGMQLARMQDIGGLRAVVASVSKVRKLETAYRDARFNHELTASKNYIDHPKADGYRSVHLIFRYSNNRAPQYDGLSVELQLRTKLQHAWATAVETMGTFLGQALKSGQGETEWREFFTTASAALAVVEKTSPVPGYEGRDRLDVFSQVAAAERKLRVLDKLGGFAIAADKITTEGGQGAYHLVVLDSANRSVYIRPYPIARLEEANRDYSAFEARTKAGERIDAVLVSAGPIDALRKAYPNYFLDTQGFITEIQSVMEEVANAKSKRSIQGDSGMRR